MTAASLSSETLHASCVAKAGRAILILGRSGAGKSDLALRLIDRGAELVSDDYTIVRRAEGRLVASAPDNLAGKIEVRGIGIIEIGAVRDVPLAIGIRLDTEIVRMPEQREQMLIAGLRLPVVAVNGLEASAAVKVEVALAQFGLDAE